MKAPSRSFLETRDAFSRFGKAMRSDDGDVDGSIQATALVVTWQAKTEPAHVGTVGRKHFGALRDALAPLGIELIDYRAGSGFHYRVKGGA